jgi:hypothetical protein
VKLSSLGRTRPQSKSLSARGLIQPAQSPTTGIFVWHWWPNRSERLSEAPWKGGCSLLSRFDPVYIPHDIENRRVATGIDEGRNSRLAALLPIYAGHEKGPGQPLKVETRVQIPLGLPSSLCVNRAGTRTAPRTRSRRSHRPGHGSCGRRHGSTTWNFGFGLPVARRAVRGQVEREVDDLLRLHQLLPIGREL